MSMTSRDVVLRTIRFQGADRLPYDLPAPYGSDIMGIGMDPSPDNRPPNGPDEWGCIWKNIGICNLGEVQEFPLKTWEDYATLKIPDIRDPRRWAPLEGARKRAGDKFMLAHGISIYERVHFLRGLENTWCDIHEAPEALGRLIDGLVEMNLYAIERFAKIGADALLIFDDWGLQSRLMISPESWREIWKPRYARVFKAAHAAGLCTFMHSCGYIVDILDDLIESGLDVVHMDQQENMGLELLGRRFGGRLTFYAPVDIQKTMVHGSLDDIRRYARDMGRLLGRPKGGFIPRWYTDPKGAGHRPEALDAMCAEFIKLSREHGQG